MKLEIGKTYTLTKVSKDWDHDTKQLIGGKLLVIPNKDSGYINYGPNYYTFKLLDRTWRGGLSSLGGNITTAEFALLVDCPLSKEIV